MRLVCGGLLLLIVNGGNFGGTFQRHRFLSLSDRRRRGAATKKPGARL
jgi:hypothetical protein